jgi:outer membrane lipoprotein-sorting protein
MERERGRMRRIVRLLPAIIVLATISFLCGCGGKDLAGEVVALLRKKAATVTSLDYACVTQDGESVYREEFAIRFPDEYRYRFFACTGEETRLAGYTAQSGNRIYRVRTRSDASGTPSLLAELLVDVPPLRNTGAYLSLYNLCGNADYYSSLVSLVQGGSLQVLSRESLDGTDAYRLKSPPGLAPETELWIDAASGLPLRKEIAFGEDRKVLFSYRDMEINGGGELEPFPGEIPPGFDLAALPVSERSLDGACRPLDMAGAASVLGFPPMVPEIDGFTLVGAYARDPAASDLFPSERSVTFPQGFRELYLVYRSGSRQCEVREAPGVEGFTAYTTGLGTLSGAYLVQQEILGGPNVQASYIAALGLQEMRLAAGKLEITVTGDLSREEMENLAIKLVSAPAVP